MDKNNKETPVSKEQEWITCKVAAATFECSIHTVKSWAKKGEVEFKQEGERQPYFINQHSLRLKLMATPGVVSNLQLKEANEAPASEGPEVESEALPEPPDKEQAEASAPPAPKPVGVPAGREDLPPRPASNRRHTARPNSGPSREKSNARRKLDYRSLLNQAKRLPLADKVRLKNEIGRLIDAA